MEDKERVKYLKEGCGRRGGECDALERGRGKRGEGLEKRKGRIVREE